MQEQQLLNQMIALSEKKLEMLREIRVLSEKQHQAFQDKALDDIEKILDRKDQIIEYIQKLDNAFLAVSENLKEMLGINSLEALSETNLDGRLRLKEIIREITGTVESVIQLEQDSLNNAAKMKNETGAKIKNVNAGKKMATAYTIKPTSTPSYFIDKKN